MAILLIRPALLHRYQSGSKVIPVAILCLLVQIRTPLPLLLPLPLPLLLPVLLLLVLLLRLLLLRLLLLLPSAWPGPNRKQG